MEYKNICVFCSARDVPQKYRALAAECGRIMGGNNMTLVYGGAKGGLMGEVSKSAHTHGAKVIGVFPDFMRGLEDLNEYLDTTILVDTLAERKTVMIEKSDAFLILPGGFGTLDEFFEVATMKILGEIDAPIIVINYDGFWSSLITLCQEIADRGFMRDIPSKIYQVVDNLTEAFDILGVKK